MTVDPLREVLSHCGAGKRISAGAENDEDRRRRAVTGLPVINRNRGTGPIHECFLSRFVIVPEHHIASAAPPLIQFAEAAVTIAAWLRLPILFPQQLQCQVLVRLKLCIELAKSTPGR